MDGELARAQAPSKKPRPPVARTAADSADQPAICHGSTNAVQDQSNDNPIYITILGPRALGPRRPSSASMPRS